jgi:hypothetical protein
VGVIAVATGVTTEGVAGSAGSGPGTAVGAAEEPDEPQAAESTGRSSIAAAVAAHRRATVRGLEIDLDW